jgi:hypothetical protein
VRKARTMTAVMYADSQALSLSSDQLARIVPADQRPASCKSNGTVSRLCVSGEAPLLRPSTHPVLRAD